MGCGVSRQKDTAGPRRRPGSVGDVVVFLPGLRVPRSIDFSQSLAGRLDKRIVERLSALRARVVDMTMQESAAALKPRRKTAARHGSSTANLLQALEDYLPVLLGLVKEGSGLRHKVQFVWANQEDNAEETAMADAWYEVLSVLHLMAMVCLLQANSLLLPRSYGDGYAPRVSEESRRATVDVFLKAAGYLDCTIRLVLPQIPSELRRQLPVDLAEGNLKALGLQALGQSIDVKVQKALDCPCVADLKSGPCGSQFVDAFSCFLRSTEVEKGSDCVKPFIALQDCIKANPEAFSKEILEEEENDEEAEKSNLKVRAPAWSREPKPKL